MFQDNQTFTANILLNIESNLFNGNQSIGTTLYSTVNFQCWFQTLYSLFFTNERNGAKTFNLKSRKKGLFRELVIQLKKENRFM